VLTHKALQHGVYFNGAMHNSLSQETTCDKNRILVNDRHHSWDMSTYSSASQLYSLYLHERDYHNPTLAWQWLLTTVYRFTIVQGYKLAVDSRERVERMIRPALLKTLSLAAELAGTVKIFRAKGLRALNRLNVAA